MSCTQNRASYCTLTLLATPAHGQLCTTQIGAHSGPPTHPLYLSSGTGYTLLSASGTLTHSHGQASDSKKPVPLLQLFWILWESKQHQQAPLLNWALSYGVTFFQSSLSHASLFFLHKSLGDKDSYGIPALSPTSWAVPPFLGASVSSLLMWRQDTVRSRQA